MGTGNTATILILLALIAASAWFSATETAFSSLNRVRVKNSAQNGNRRAALTLRLVDEYDKTLSTILVGNNIVNIALASISTIFFVRLFGMPGTLISTIVITVLVLIFGEITPKSIARQMPERTAMLFAPLLRIIGVVLTPLNFLFGLWGRLVARLLKTSSRPTITEEELRTLVDEAQQDGAIPPEDAEMIESAFAFNDGKVADILTPRVELVAAPKTATLADLAQLFRQSGYTRIPVYHQSADNIIGMVHLHDVFDAFTLPSKSLADILMPVEYVPPSTRVHALLRLLQQKKSHLAVVTDEYGGTMGIVTMEDILEELVGEIWDEHDEVEQPIRTLAGGSIVATGAAEIQDVFAAMGFATPTNSTTVSGWVTEQLARLPRPGDSFAVAGVRVKVTKTGARRVQECVFSHEAAGDAASL